MNAKGFEGRSLDHLPGRDPELVAHERELVREGDVDRPEGVLVELRGLGDDRARDPDDDVDDLLVEELGPARASSVTPATSFGVVLIVKFLFPGSTRSGA